MLTKCAAPTCNVLFRYLGRGRLYRVEPDSSGTSDSDEFGTSFQEEYFWLCEHCCEQFHLNLDCEGKVIVVPISRHVPDGRPPVGVISREAGKLMRSVSVFSRHDHLSDPAEKGTQLRRIKQRLR